ncbi:putative disease resistance RPP13-like protein 3 [Abeliophyllum distichum]|uniref:Disease resistance RPP13-like protein 3 n=1 Tax=Abeliophyllum distichum TaxID=126358 RepID=A0ABD1NSY0_9LAMI
MESSVNFHASQYLNLRLPQVMVKIKLIRLPLEKLKKYPTEQVSSQDEKPLEDIVVDFHADANRIAGMLKDVENPSKKAPSTEEDISVGLDDEENEITEILLGNQKNNKLFLFGGCQGLGKTTLTKKIYGDDRIVKYFHKRAYCVISQTYDKKNTLIAILASMSSLERDELSKLDEETLGEKLYQKNQSGSKILFTTRFEKIGSQASDKSIVRNLRFLTDDECWELLKIKVFHNVQLEDIGELEDIGMKIARKCGGLPLAVVVIAAVLANIKKNKAKWEEVAESLSSHISKDNSCMKILELSYNYLPMHLKPCFLYFGAFEEDREIPVQKLITLWVAEGFVQKVNKKVNKKQSNAVSYGYLTNLNSRGLVQVGKRRSDGGVKTCYVHDLSREMCLTISENDNFMKVVQEKLTLTDFKLNSEEMKMIGELPKLEVLKLESAVIEDNQWNPNEVLTRFDTAIPSSVGDIPTLVKIKVKWCTKQVEESALKILEEQTDELLKVIIR